MSQPASRSGAGILVKFLVAVVLISLVILAAVFMGELPIGQWHVMVGSIRHLHTIAIKWSQLLLHKRSIPE